MTILVSGAAGKTGQAVIRALNNQGETVRAFVRRQENVDLVKKLGAKEVVVGDLGDRSDLKRAFDSVRVVYLICPNVYPEELDIACRATFAARQAGTVRFVYHSVLHPQIEKMPHHWQKMRVEEHLFESGLDFTILQPAPYMQNLLAHWHSITHDGILPLPYSPESRLSLVDLEDVGTAAARVLQEDGHSGAVYELAATRGLSQNDVAAIFSDELGRKVQAQYVPLERWQQSVSGLSGYALDSLLKMFHYYDSYGLWSSPGVLEWLLQRPPTSLGAFVRRTIALQGEH